jgi:aminoglycoside phosphotransferase (APT) family kinase protein
MAQPPDSRDDTLAAPLRAWIERSLGPSTRLVRVAAFPASSTAMHLVDVALADGSAQRLVLRRYHDAGRLAHDPWYQPANEARALCLVADSAVPAPRLFAAKLEADVPALLESWVPGGPAWEPDDLEAYLARAAEVLVALHALSVPKAAGLPAYAPYRDDPYGYAPGHERDRIVSPPYSTRPGLWERVGDALNLPRPAHRTTFLHRDYHPGNVLWDGARVTGVVDWATAALGPPGIDLARMRLNLAARHGKCAADHFSEAYVLAGGDASARDPYWDLLDAADLLPDLIPPAQRAGRDLARFEDWVESVLAELGGSSRALPPAIQN